MAHKHHNEIKEELSFEEKLTRLLEHWIKHNEDHAANYKKWADKVKENNLDDIALLLEEISNMTISINDRFKKALKLVRMDS